MVEQTIPNDMLRQQVLDKVERQRRLPPPPPSHMVKLLGSVLEAYLINHNHLREDLAKELGVEEEFVDALVEGMIPESEISDELLVELAHAIGYEPNLLRIILNRPLERGAGWMAMAGDSVAEAPIQLETQMRPGGMHNCGVEGCPGHDTFSASCLDAKRKTSEVEVVAQESEGSELVDLQYLLQRIENQQQDIRVKHQHFQSALRTIEQGLNRLYEKISSAPEAPASTLRELDELYEQFQRASASNTLLSLVNNVVKPEDEPIAVNWVEFSETAERNNR
ncbi:MAG: hypothetical protein K8L97_05375 [Anaerolineae bacterium]|nr:hypothetical protein [Anaerolineae bacterium]